MLFCIETHLTKDVRGGGGPDPHIPSRSAHANLVIKHVYVFMLNYSFRSSRICVTKLVYPAKVIHQNNEFLSERLLDFPVLKEAIGPI